MLNSRRRRQYAKKAYTRMTKDGKWVQNNKHTETGKKSRRERESETMEKPKADYEFRWHW